jgi:hypothetical protein
MVTVLALAGSNTRPAEPTSVVNEVPFGLPCTDSVCVRASHAGGSRSATWSMATAAPRSTWTHCGNALLALSQ